MNECLAGYLPEMTQYWTRFMDIMVFMLPSDQIVELNEVSKSKSQFLGDGRGGSLRPVL